ncbi:hypothetical protein TSUD_156100 [Trifolium subterraneum]|uniref:asparagine--tRNA ligase n=1 Tax=Trifolium subterraneum TaxID=3900 RepID=A0A2Z6M162_TRISU|nr:hypothetical protein TSUD_156100 [Trifolium subterraneum]
MSVAMATRPLRLVKPYSYALFTYLNASTPNKPSFLRPFSSPRRRLFCSATLPSAANDTTNKVPQFRKKLKVSDVKDDQFDSLGNTLVLQGWVRTLRLQSSVTFLEINDGSCISNMQCVLDSEVEGYDQVARVRNALAYATHKFFQENGFVWVSSPIITASDCEGAGEQFCVTTLIPNSHETADSPVDAIPKTNNKLIDWSKDFFGKPAFLTVSGQLNAETYATALSDMIEPELAFADLNDDMACATAYLQFVIKHILDNCKEDMEFFNTWIDKGIIDRLSDVAEKDVLQITYTEAVDLLSRANKKFEFPVKWGCDLQSEHERYITEEAFGGSPVIIRDYPKACYFSPSFSVHYVQAADIKAFYMRQNDDGRTVAAMDMLVPKIGELIGGSQREERLDLLEARLDDLKLNKDAYWWYLDLRRYGSVPHAGFGLGFERLVQFATGMDNIRDVIPFPRTPGSAEF